MEELTTRVKLLKGRKEKWPPDYEEIILEVLRDDQAPVLDRAHAISRADFELAINDEILAAILKIALRESEPPTLRYWALLGLGSALGECFRLGFNGPEQPHLSARAFELTRKILRNLYLVPDLPDLLKRAVLESSAQAPDDWHPEAIRAAFNHSNEEWQDSAVSCLQYVPGFEREIVTVLESRKSVLQQREALSAVTVWRVDAAWPYVVELLNAADPDVDVLPWAIEAAAKLRPAEAIPLISPWRDSEHSRVRLRAELSVLDACEATGLPDPEKEAWRVLRDVEEELLEGDGFVAGELLN